MFENAVWICRLPGLLVLGVLALTAGCATQPPIPRTLAHHLVVLELPPTVGDRSLRRVLHGKHEQVTPAVLAADRQRINATLTTTLAQSLQCVASPSRSLAIEIIASDDAPDATMMGHALDSATLRTLQASHPADAYLRLKVTDYGETPRRWKGAYVAFEVVATLAIAAVLYVHKVTRAVAGAYIVEESVEEFSEGYAGFWVFNRLSRPVRIEADMLDGQTGELLGREAHVGLASWRWRHLWHMDNATRDGLLDTSMHKALQPFAALCQRNSAP
ncbi:MAG: hypothetical protein ACRETG_05370 [Steroidobacteraceae bacterium]